MIKLERTSVMNFEGAMRGARNPLNSWAKSDSKYDEKGNKVIAGLKRISKPGLRVYAAKDELPKVLNGLGIALISTSKGIMTDKKARQEGIGGEVLAYIW